MNIISTKGIKNPLANMIASWYIYMNEWMDDSPVWGVEKKWMKQDLYVCYS